MEFPVTDFVDFWSQGQKVIKSRLLGLILSMLENHQILTSETDFADIWRQTQRVIKSRRLGLILLTSGTKARKSLSRDFWHCFC